MSARQIWSIPRFRCPWVDSDRFGKNPKIDTNPPLYRHLSHVVLAYSVLCSDAGLFGDEPCALLRFAGGGQAVIRCSAAGASCHGFVTPWMPLLGIPGTRAGTRDRALGSKRSRGCGTDPGTRPPAASLGPRRMATDMVQGNCLAVQATPSRRIRGYPLRGPERQVGAICACLQYDRGHIPLEP
jgi:hypothetical protein